MNLEVIGARLRVQVTAYCGRWRHPTLEPFTVHPVVGLKHWWGKPESARPGCHAADGADGDLVYIGKAS